MHMAELSNVQSRTLYSHLGPVYTRSPKVSHRPDAKTVGHVYDTHRDTLYVTKCVCVISQLPLVHIFQRILSSMHSVIMSSLGPEMPLESYVYNIIYEVPLPPPGRSMQIYTTTGTIVCQRPGELGVSLDVSHSNIPMHCMYSFINCRFLLSSVIHLSFSPCYL